jgi:hypothetical protein
MSDKTTEELLEELIFQQKVANQIALINVKIATSQATGAHYTVRVNEIRKLERLSKL